MAQNSCGSEGICRIVSAFAARSDATVDKIVELFRKLSLAQPQGFQQTNEGSAKTGAGTSQISMTEAVQDDVVVCLCCGKSFKMLKRHLRAEHDLSESEYRFRFGLDEAMPLVAPAYSRKKADQARRSGLGRYPHQDRGEEVV
jgi:predicted transcriptional regulator